LLGLFEHAVQLVLVFHELVYVQVSHAVHVLLVQLYLNQQLHVNQQLFAAVHRPVQLYLLLIAVHALQLVLVFHALVYVPFEHAVHVLFVQL